MDLLTWAKALNCADVVLTQHACSDCRAVSVHIVRPAAELGRALQGLSLWRRLALVYLGVVPLVHPNALNLLLIIDRADAGSITHIRLELRIAEFGVVAQVLEHELALRIPSTLIVEAVVFHA